MPHYSHALGLLRSLMYDFKDADGHFVKQFRLGEGFDARIRESHPYAMFTEAGYAFDWSILPQISTAAVHLGNSLLKRQQWVCQRYRLR